MDKQIYSRRQLCEMFGLSANALYLLVYRGTLKPERIVSPADGRTVEYRFGPEALEVLGRAKNPIGRARRPRGWRKRKKSAGSV